MKHQYKVNTIVDFTGDDKGNFYLLTRSGFYAFNLKRELWYRYDDYKPDEVEKLVFAYGYSVVNISDNELLLSTRKGAFIFNASLKIMMPLKASTHSWLNILNEAKFRVIYKAVDEFITMDTAEGFRVFNISKRSGSEINIGAHLGNFNWRTTMYKVNDTLYAVCQRNLSFNLIHLVKHSGEFIFQPEKYFGTFRCNSLMNDRNNRLWVGTGSGLFHQKNNSGSIEQLSIPEDRRIYASDPLYRMITIANEKIFVSSNGSGVHIFDRRDKHFITGIDFRSISRSAGNSMSCIAYNKDTVIAGNSSALIYINTNDYRFSAIPLPEWDTTNWITSLYKDKIGNVYAGKNEEGVIYKKMRNTTNFLSEDHKENLFFKILLARNISEDNEGNIWFSGHGMSRYNINKQNFDFIFDSFPAIKISRREVIGLTIGNDGRMYFGVAENGLIIYDPSTKKFSHFTRNEGLPDNNVLALRLLDEYLWIGTESAIARLEIKTGKIESFNMNDILTDEPFTGFAFYYDSANKQLYAPLSRSIIRFDPDKIRSNSMKPRFFIDNMQVNNNRTIYQPDVIIKLPYNENSLVVNVASINFEDAWSNQLFYRFMKDEENNVWQFAGEQTSFNFINLQPGTHLLQFKLQSTNNTWEPQIIELQIIILAPFWKTGWFIAIVILTIIALLYLIYRSRIKSVHKAANIDKHLAELEIKGLHAQMNPHFIFNALNSIKEMILVDDKADASRYLSKFAQLIRLNLEHSRQTFITVKQCIHHLEQYLDMEQIRFDNFSFKIEIAEDIAVNEIKIAPMLLQPLVENALWHGLKSIKDEKILVVRLYLQQKQLVCEVEDNGTGLLNHNEQNGNKHNPIGIANIQERLAVLNEKYQMKCSLKLIDKAAVKKGEQGTISLLTITT